MALQISDTSPRIQYTATSGQTTFSVPFEFFDDEDLLVINTNSGGIDTTLTLSSNPTLVTEYSVTGAGVNGGGSITLGSGATLNDTYTILRNLPTERVTDFPTSGTFPINSLNTELDKIIALIQQKEVDINLMPKAASTTSTAYGLTFPELVANKVLSVNSAGTGLLFSQEIGNYRGNWAASTAYVQRDLVRDSSNGNIYIINTAHTSSGSEPLSSNANSSYYDLIVDAESASTYATNAANSASAAASSASAASTSASNAATSESNAATSESNASTSASNASTSATNASNSATAAATSASNAATSESNASTSETNAASSASAASSSATSASNSASTATTQASNASTSASNAATSASNAATSESNAATSETNAATSASTASTQATNASNSASAASTSATNAANSASAAANSAASAASAYDTFDDRYLGSKTSDPTLDNDGNALVTGALYFNSSANEMRVFDGGNWIAASSAGTASLIVYEYTATASQTTFSGSDDNAATLSYSVNNLIVTLNGITLDSSDYTATSGTSIVLASGATSGDILNVYAFKSFTVSELNANNLTDGTIPDARFPAVLPAIDGSNLTGITSVGGAVGVDFNDNVKAQFGTSQDLEIYHDGSNSIIKDAGTGNLILGGQNFQVMNSALNESMILGINNGAVILYYDNASKLATTSTGVDVTGTVTATSFSGDGSSLTGITSTTINNNADNRIITGSATANTLEAESDLIYNGTNLGVGTTSPSRKLHVETSNTDTSQIYTKTSNSSAGSGAIFYNDAGQASAIQFNGSANSGLGGTNSMNIGTITNNEIMFFQNNGNRMKITGDGLIPAVTNTYDLGSASLVWRNIYTSDFHMSNEGLDKGNDIDGTKGSWTFQEGEENLYLINNKNGKKYKFNLTEIE